MLDGPLYGIRRRRSLSFIRYVKTHHRRLLALDLWLRVPGLSVGERSGLFALPDDLYACYLRVGDPGPWAGPWAGIARIEVPAGIGLVRLRAPSGRAGAGEPDPDRGPGTAPAPPAGRRPAGAAVGA